MTQYNDNAGLSQQISDLRRQIMQLQTQPRLISSSIDRGGTQSSDYDGSGINDPGTTGWMIGTDEATGAGYIHLNGQNLDTGRPAATYRAVATRNSLAASTWHDLPIDTVEQSQGTLPWAMNNVGSTWRIKFTKPGFYMFTGAASLGAANFTLRLINITTGQVTTQENMGTTVSNTSAVSAAAYFAANQENAFQIYYPGTFNTLTDLVASPTRLTVFRI